MKDLCVKVSAIGALLVCLPVMYRIHQGDIFNVTSYFLWAALSLVCVLVLVRAKKGGYPLLVGYFFSDLSIAIYSYVKNGKANFAQFEWFIVFLTTLCAILYVWCEYAKNFKPGVIVNGIACMVAGIPQIIDMFCNPYQVSFVVCAMYTSINFLGYYGERNFNGKFIPGLSIIYGIVITGGVIVARF